MRLNRRRVSEIARNPAVCVSLGFTLEIHFGETASPNEMPSH